MSTTFSPDEIIQANQFRTLSQKSLQQELRVHEKLGVYFPNQGLTAVMLTYERYKALLERLAELENAAEDSELLREYGERAHTPRDMWLEHPDGVSTLDAYRQRQEDVTRK